MMISLEKKNLNQSGPKCPLNPITALSTFKLVSTNFGLLLVYYSFGGFLSMNVSQEQRLTKIGEFQFETKTGNYRRNKWKNEIWSIVRGQTQQRKQGQLVRLRSEGRVSLYIGKLIRRMWNSRGRGQPVMQDKGEYLTQWE